MQQEQEQEQVWFGFRRPTSLTGEAVTHIMSPHHSWVPHLCSLTTYTLRMVQRTHAIQTSPRYPSFFDRSDLYQLSPHRLVPTPFLVRTASAASTLLCPNTTKPLFPPPGPQVMAMSLTSCSLSQFSQPLYIPPPQNIPQQFLCVVMKHPLTKVPVSLTAEHIPRHQSASIPHFSY